MVESKSQKRLFLITAIAPAALLFVAVVVYPLLSGVGYSFFKWSGASSNRTFVGLDNYVKLVQDPLIPQVIAHDLFLVIIKILGIMLLAMFFAVALTQFRFREASFYRVVFFFPQIMAAVTIGILWIFVFNYDLGLVNGLLRALGLGEWARSWLGDQSTALASLAIPVIWAGVGFFMLWLMSAIAGVPTSLLEASLLDGATRWRQFWNITVPLIWPQMRDAIVYIAITSLNGAFILVVVMTNGGPNNATQLMGSYLMEQAFTRYNFGYGAAIGSLILVVASTVVFLLRWLMRKDPLKDTA
ncbi:MAG: sugar ABC transporter permease [Propionicimonas sp.]